LFPLVVGFFKGCTEVPILFEPPVYSHWSYRAVAAECHCAVANYRGAFKALLSIEKSNILIVKSSLDHWLQVPYLFMALLPTAVCSE
jgi:hypothetical protein